MRVVMLFHLLLSMQQNLSIRFGVLVVYLKLYMLKGSDSGWISEQIFTDWFQHCFLELTKYIGYPLLLVMDNHPAHISIDVIELALKNQVILLCLPPHSTHTVHPLDVVTLRCVQDFTGE